MLLDYMFYWKDISKLTVKTISFATNTYFSTIPIHPSNGIHWCSRKRLFEFSEASVHLGFEEILLRKFLHTS